MDEKERARALESTLGQIEKQFGKGSILRLGSKDAIVPISVISTGSISLDSALGTGGFPRGRVCEIYGPESSGKTTTGGRALKFYSSVRIDIRRIAAIKDGDVVVGNRTKVKVVKNKLASPFREAEFDIVYGEGISKEGDLIDLGVAQSIVEKSGSWLSYKGDRIGQGRENAKQFLKDNVDMRNSIELELRKALGLVKADPSNLAATGTGPQPVPAPASSGPKAGPVMSPRGR